MESKGKTGGFWRRLGQAVGIHVSEEQDWNIELKPRFFVVVGGIFLAGILFTAGSVKYSTSPTFCNSCHIMEPYYKAWKASKHNKVACVECHYPPSKPQTLLWKKFQAVSQVVKYVTRTYSSKPFAEVEDAACLRSGCHSTRLLEGRTAAKSGVKFDHRPHLLDKRRGRQLRCVSCHGQVMIGEHIEVTYGTCFLCHFKGMGVGKNLKPLGGCTGCHDVPARPIQVGNMTYNHRDFVTKQGISCIDCHADVVRGEGQANQDRCFTCHNQPEKLAKYGDTPFLHENHVTKHNVACFHCHQEIRHGIMADESQKVPRLNEPAFEKTEAGAAPKALPPGHPALHVAQTPGLIFNCADCHDNKHFGQREMYTGQTKGLGLKDMPSPMFLAQVDCAGCHYKDAGGRDANFKGHNLKASEKGCVKCHGEKFKGIWEETKNELTTGIDKLEGNLAAARTALEKATVADPERKKLKEGLDRAEKLQGFVRAGRGEHNIYLASSALREEARLLADIGTKLGATLPDVSEEPLISGSYCAILCHARVGVKVPPDTVKVFGKTMPHGQHAGMMGCVKCHDISGHKKVPLKQNVRKTVCKECHPD